MARYLAAAAALVAPAVMALADASGPDSAPAAPSLAGQLLVATPDMGDPRFERTVILMVRHSDEGALGIVINRPVEEHSIAELLEAIGQSAEGVQGKVRVFAGGPVEPRIGFVLHTTDYARAETLPVDNRVAVTSTPEILRDIGGGKGPKKALVAFGYAGWSAGQLERELAHRDWATAADDLDLVFDEDRDTVWKKAWERRTLNL